MADADSPARDGVRWLQSVPVTLAFCLVLVSVYAAELYVWSRLGVRAFTTLFVASQRPSLGWLLAPLAHSPRDPLHLAGNLLQILVFGSIAERRLTSDRYVGVIVASAFASMGAQVASYAAAGPIGRAFGTMGASGIGLAMAGLVLVDSLRYHDLTGQWHGETAWLWTVLAGLVVVDAAVRAVVGTPGVGDVGHLVGIGLGVSYGFVRSQSAVLRPGRERWAGRE